MHYSYVWNLMEKATKKATKQATNPFFVVTGQKTIKNIGEQV